MCSRYSVRLNSFGINTQGCVRRAAPTPSISRRVMHCVSDDDLQELVQRFWAVEELAPPLKIMNPEDEACEQLFVNTTLPSSVRSELPPAATCPLG